MDLSTELKSAAVLEGGGLGRAGPRLKETGRGGRLEAA